MKKNIVKNMESKKKQIARICAVLIVVSYFLPWFSAVIFSVSGYQLGMLAELRGNFSGNDEIIFWVYASYIIPVLGLASAIMNQKRLYLMTSVYTLLVITWIFLDIGIDLRTMGIGLIISVFASIGQIWGSFYLNNELKASTAE